MGTSEGDGTAILDFQVGLPQAATAGCRQNRVQNLPADTISAFRSDRPEAPYSHRNS